LLHCVKLGDSTLTGDVARVAPHSPIFGNVSICSRITPQTRHNACVVDRASQCQTQRETKHDSGKSLAVLDCQYP